jgi:hypothetical protein
LISINYTGPQLGQHIGYGAFSGGNTTCKSNDFHGLIVAEQWRPDQIFPLSWQLVWRIFTFFT